VVVRAEDIDVTKLSKTADAGQDLLDLTTMFKGKVEKVIACGGQHRKAALKQVYDWDYGEIGKIQEVIWKQKEKQEGEVGTASVSTELKEKEDQLKVKKRALKLMPQWGVAVYGYGMCLINIFKLFIISTEERRSRR
jgi:hypothetical protein